MAQVVRTGMALTKRQRFTIAEVNAGATILAAVPGMAYRLVDCIASAVGGAASAVTTVDIIGTNFGSGTGASTVAAGLPVVTINGKACIVPSTYVPPVAAVTV